MGIHKKLIILNRYVNTYLLLSIFIFLLISFNAKSVENNYVVNDISIDIKEKDLRKARNIAINNAYRIGFQRLLFWITTKNAKEISVILDNINLKSYVTGYSIGSEKLSTFRYRADISVNYEKESINKLLNESNISFFNKRGPKTLILPVLKWGNRITLWDDPNPWFDAWLNIPIDSNFTPIITPYGEVEDLILISASEAILGNKERLKLIANRYKVDEVMILIAKITNTSEGKLALEINGYRGLNKEKLFFPVFVSKKNEKIEAFLLRAAEQIGQINDDLWVNKNLEKILNEVRVKLRIYFSSLDEWNNIKKNIIKTKMIKNYMITNLASKNASVQITVAYGDENDLMMSFAKEGFYLNTQNQIWELSNSKSINSEKNNKESFINYED